MSGRETKTASFFPPKIALSGMDEADKRGSRAFFLFSGVFSG